MLLLNLREEVQELRRLIQIVRAHFAGMSEDERQEFGKRFRRGTKMDFAEAMSKGSIQYKDFGDMKVKLYVQALEGGLENEHERVVALIDENLRVGENYFEPVVAKASDAYREMNESQRNSLKVKDVEERQIGESSEDGLCCWASRSSPNFGSDACGRRKQGNQGYGEWSLWRPVCIKRVYACSIAMIRCDGAWRQSWVAGTVSARDRQTPKKIAMVNDEMEFVKSRNNDEMEFVKSRNKDQNGVLQVFASAEPWFWKRKSCGQSRWREKKQQKVPGLGAAELVCGGPPAVLCPATACEKFQQRWIGVWPRSCCTQWTTVLEKEPRDEQRNSCSCRWCVMLKGLSCGASSQPNVRACRKKGQ